MLDTLVMDRCTPSRIVEAKDWIPRTLVEAQAAWEDLRERNNEIRKRFQDSQRKGVLLRSSAMLEAWQS